MKRLTPSSNVVAYTAPPRERAHRRMEEGASHGVCWHRQFERQCILCSTLVHL